MNKENTKYMEETKKAGERIRNQRIETFLTETIEYFDNKSNLNDKEKRLSTEAWNIRNMLPSDIHV